MLGVSRPGSQGNRRLANLNRTISTMRDEKGEYAATMEILLRSFRDTVEANTILEDTIAA